MGIDSGKTPDKNEVRNDPNPLEELAQRFLRFCGLFTPYFRFSSRPVDHHARSYISGLMQARRKNMERMAGVVPNTDAQALQHFLSNSRWDPRAVISKVAVIADGLIGGSPDTGLLLDETAFGKKGEKSVGVARQYSGRQGKVDNCQVAVFARSSVACSRR